LKWRIIAIKCTIMEKAHEFSGNIFGDDIDEMEVYLRQCNAFSEHTEAKLNIIPR